MGKAHRLETAVAHPGSCTAGSLVRALDQPMRKATGDPHLEKRERESGKGSQTHASVSVSLSLSLTHTHTHTHTLRRPSPWAKGKNIPFC
ncbi:hypothetical protein QQF64_024490 [Cirrhinus molitorella]|uniref:Uncharacterized protein n=1 Tax=Cirrhinus molitorella TaxID=172907 RepID=A0ABR3NLD1_9TELE